MKSTFFFGAAEPASCFFFVVVVVLRAAAASSWAQPFSYPAQLYLPASASWEDLADHDPGELYLPDVHLFGADCSAEASPRTDPVANWAWPINVDRDLPYADFLASFEAYKVGVTGL